MKYFIASLTIIIAFSGVLLFEEKFGIKKIALKAQYSDTQNRPKIILNVDDYLTYGEIRDALAQQDCDDLSPILKVSHQNNEYYISPMFHTCKPYWFCGRGTRALTIRESFIESIYPFAFYQISDFNISRTFEDTFANEPYSKYGRNTNRYSLIQFEFKNQTNIQQFKNHLLSVIAAHQYSEKCLNKEIPFNLVLERPVPLPPLPPPPPPAY